MDSLYELNGLMSYVMSDITSTKNYNPEGISYDTSYHDIAKGYTAYQATLAKI